MSTALIISPTLAYFNMSEICGHDNKGDRKHRPIVVSWDDVCKSLLQMYFYDNEFSDCINKVVKYCKAYFNMLEICGQDNKGDRKHRPIVVSWDDVCKSLLQMYFYDNEFSDCINKVVKYCKEKIVSMQYSDCIGEHGQENVYEIFLDDKCRHFYELLPDNGSSKSCKKTALHHIYGVTKQSSGPHAELFPMNAVLDVRRISQKLFNDMLITSTDGINNCLQSCHHVENCSWFNDELLNELCQLTSTKHEKNTTCSGYQWDEGTKHQEKVSNMPNKELSFKNDHFTKYACWDNQTETPTDKSVTDEQTKIQKNISVKTNKNFSCRGDHVEKLVAWNDQEKRPTAKSKIHIARKDEHTKYQGQLCTKTKKKLSCQDDQVRTLVALTKSDVDRHERCMLSDSTIFDPGTNERKSEQEGHGRPVLTDPTITYSTKIGRQHVQKYPPPTSTKVYHIKDDKKLNKRNRDEHSVSQDIENNQTRAFCFKPSLWYRILILFIVIAVTTAAVNTVFVYEPKPEIYATEGMKQIFTCKLSADVSYYDVAWTKDERLLNNQASDFERFTIPKNIRRRHHVLIIDPVKREDKGMYRCLVRDITGTTLYFSSGSSLHVKKVPGSQYPLVTLSKYTYVVGETIKATCLCERLDTPPTIVWRNTQGSSTPFSNSTHTGSTILFNASMELNGRTVGCKMTTSNQEVPRYKRSLSINIINSQSTLLTTTPFNTVVVTNISTPNPSITKIKEIITELEEETLRENEELFAKSGVNSMNNNLFAIFICIVYIYIL